MHCGSASKAMMRFLIVQFVLMACVFAASASAQRNITPTLDAAMEADAKHNLDVARQAFTPAKQAYKQVLLRFEETYATYPEFSGIGEFIYMAGMSSYYLSENKGKQKVDLRSEREKKKYAPEKLRSDAVAYLSIVVDKYPDIKDIETAKKTLELLKK